MEPELHHMPVMIGRLAGHASGGFETGTGK